MTTKTRTQRALLERRVREFYDRVTRREFERCYAMLDPSVRANPASVTLLQYQKSLESFLNYFGTVDVQNDSLELHLDEPNGLYGDGDFAVGQLVWRDQAGEEHVFQERWVRVGRHWYTRSTGFLTPSAKRVLPPDDQGAAGRMSLRLARFQSADRAGREPGSRLLRGSASRGVAMAARAVTGRGGAAALTTGVARGKGRPVPPLLPEVPAAT
jgi:hypothetical protein